MYTSSAPPARYRGAGGRAPPPVPAEARVRGGSRSSSPATGRAPSQSAPRGNANGAQRWVREEEEGGFLSASDLVKSLQPVPRRPAHHAHHRAAGRTRPPPQYGAPMPPQQARYGHGRTPPHAAESWQPLEAMPASVGFQEWPFDSSPGGSVASSAPTVAGERPPPGLDSYLDRNPAYMRQHGPKEPMAAVRGGRIVAGRNVNSRQVRQTESYNPEEFKSEDQEEMTRRRAYQAMHEHQRRSQFQNQSQLQRYQQHQMRPSASQTQQYHRAMQHEFTYPQQTSQFQSQAHQQYRRGPPNAGRTGPASAAGAGNPPPYSREIRPDVRGHGGSTSFDPPRRIPRSLPMPTSVSASAASHSSAAMAITPLPATPTATMGFSNEQGRASRGSAPPRRYSVQDSPSFGPDMGEMPLEPVPMDMYSGETDIPPTAADLEAARRDDYARIRYLPQPQRQQQVRRTQRVAQLAGEPVEGDGRPPAGFDWNERGIAGRPYQQGLAPPAPEVAGPTGNQPAQGKPRVDEDEETDDDLPLSASLNRRRQATTTAAAASDRKPKAKRPRTASSDGLSSASASRASRSATGSASTAATKSGNAKTSKSAGKKAKATVASEGDEAAPKRRCGRKSMNYSSEQKRERNRAAVKKCRQRQALKYEYLQHKAEALESENQALSEMLVKNTELKQEERTSLTRGIQMDILLKIKEIFMQSLPKDFVLDADSIWDLNSVLAVSMPSRCYYGIESIKDFWRTSLRMRNKGKIRSFWAWLFRLPPGDRFLEFEIQPFSPTSNLYFITWTTKSTPPLAGSMVIMFGNGHRVTLHVECFGWLIWRYLLTNEPFPEPGMD